MEIEHLCHIKFSWKEVRRALADCIEVEANDLTAGTPENERLLDLAEKARDPHSGIETEDGGLVLMINGVAFTETIGENDGKD